MTSKVADGRYTMWYWTINHAVSDHNIRDWERMCKLRLWYNWATIAAFTWKERGKKILGLAVHAEIRTGDVPKCKSEAFLIVASMLAAHLAVESKS